MPRSRVAVTAGCAVLFGGVSPAGAHPMPGVGDFYAGMLHPLISVESALAVVALGLLVGVQAGRANASIAGTFLSVAAGALLAIVIGGGIQTAWLGVPVVALGALLAWSPVVPSLVLPVLAVATGVLVGLVNGGEMGTDVEPARFIAGMAVTCVVATSCCGGLARGLRCRLAHIGVRVLGSWLVAIGVVILSVAFLRAPAT